MIDSQGESRCRQEIGIFFFIQASNASHVRITSAFCQSQCLAGQRHCCHADVQRMLYSVFQTCAPTADSQTACGRDGVTRADVCSRARAGRP